jgi:hypothetical protein
MNVKPHPQFKQSVVIPALDIDALMLKQFNQPVSITGKAERRIVANLLSHLDAAGFTPTAVDNRDDLLKVRTAKSAMERIFEVVSDPILYVRKRGESKRTHTITLVQGNGTDMISDWTYTEGDPDGFDAAMGAFNAEDWA